MILQAIILFTAIAAFLLGAFVYFKNRNHPINKSFAFTSLLMGLWILTNLFIGLTKDPFWIKPMYGFGGLGICGVLIFVSEFCEVGISRLRKTIYWSIAFLFSILPASKFFVSGVHDIKLGTFEGTFGIGFYLWCAYGVVFMGLGTFLFIRTYIKTKGFKRLQIKYVATGFISTAIFVTFVDVIMPILGNNNLMALDSTSTLLYLSFTAYAIIRYRVMEIDTVIHQTILWLATSAWLILPAYLLFKIVHPWLVNLTPLWLTISAAAFFYIFLWYYRFSQPKIDHFFRRRKYDYQTILGKVAEKIATTINIEDLSRNLLNEVCETMYLRNSLLYIRDREENKYSLIARRGYKETSGVRQRAELELYTRKELFALPESKKVLIADNTLCKWLAKHLDVLEREQVEINPQYEEIRQELLGWFKAQEIELIVPIIFENNIHAILGLGKKENLQLYTKKDLELLKKLGQEAGVTIFNALHYEDSLEKERLQEEMKMGRQIQTALLPQQTPFVEDLNIQGFMQPAKEIGGDYYDFLSKNKQNLDIVIGDVSGKGVAAGLLMATVKATLRGLSMQNISPKEILTWTNTILYEYTKGRKFMTLLYLQWSSAEKKLRYSSAGHEHIIIYRALTNQVESIMSGGFMLGILPDISHFLEEKEEKLSLGDKVIIYTDGITEGRNTDEEMFSLHRLINAVSRHGNKSAGQLLTVLKDEIYNFIGEREQYDDITLVVMEAT